jgi:hypothetical protein
MRTLIGMIPTLAGITWLVRQGLYAPGTRWQFSVIGIGVPSAVSRPLARCVSGLRLLSEVDERFQHLSCARAASISCA